MQGTETVVAAGRIGPYKLRGELGRGGMAIVWRAWDPDLEREVALKEPLTDPRLPEATARELGERFVAEARAAARLSHPGIVTVYAAVALVVLGLMVANALGGVSGGGSSSQVAATEQTQDAATDAGSDTDTVTEQAQGEAADDTVVPTRASLSEY